MLLTAVRSSMSRTGGEVTLGPFKTNKSRRSVGLTEKATEALRAHLSRQFEEEMERTGSLYHRVGLVFVNETGGIINPSNLRNRSFARLLKHAGLLDTASTTSDTVALRC